MRYAIHFTPPIHHPLAIAAASWLGRNVYSGDAVEHPPVPGFTNREIAFHTALPRRDGFHATMKAPFRLAPGVSESDLLKALMRFAGKIEPILIEQLEVARLGEFMGLLPQVPCEAATYLAARTVQEFDQYRAPLTEAEIERRDPYRLSAAQFANLHRWGYPYVMDEYRFHMPLTGPVDRTLATRLEPALRQVFEPHLVEPLKVTSLALFVETEPGAPFRVHSQHPLGRMGVRRSA